MHSSATPKPKVTNWRCALRCEKKRQPKHVLPSTFRWKSRTSKLIIHIRLCVLFFRIIIGLACDFLSILLHILCACVFSILYPTTNDTTNTILTIKTASRIHHKKIHVHAFRQHRQPHKHTHKSYTHCAKRKEYIPSVGSGLGVGSEGAAGEKNMHDAEFTCALFRFIQLTCEGHNLGKLWA